MVKTVAQQYCKNLTDDEIHQIDWSIKMKYLEKNPVTFAGQINYIFRQLWGNVYLSGMHLIGQILNFDEWREYQGREQNTSCS